MDTRLNLDKLIESAAGNGKTNYVSCKFKLNLLLRMKGLLDVVTGASPKPFEAYVGYVDWIKKDIVAQTIVGLYVDERIALKITTCTSAASMIEMLEAFYDKRSRKTTSMLQ